MANKGAWWKAALWGWVIILSGCTANHEAAKDATPTPIIPTSTIAPTARPTLAPTPTLTPLPPTFTPLPTLPPDEAEAMVLELLETNGGCELPCWWGIDPGESTSEDIHRILEPLRFHQGSSLEGLTIIGEGFGGPGFTLINVEVRTQKAISESIRVAISMPRGNAVFREAISDLTMNGMVSRFGQPSRVYVGLDPATTVPESEPGIYHIWIFFDESGILVSYAGPHFVPNDLDRYIEVCPSLDDLGTITLYLQQPFKDNPLESLLDLVFVGKTDFFQQLVDHREIIPWDEAVSSDYSDFNFYVSEGGHDSCFESLREIWQ